jgi:Protein of unknown function (DUF433)
MELVTSGIDLATSPLRKAVKASAAKGSRVEKTNPRPGAVDRSARTVEFAAFAEEVRRELVPRGPLESLMTDHVVQSAWQLKATLGRQAEALFGGKAIPDAAGKLKQAAQSLSEALNSLDSLRSRRLRIEPSPSPLGVDDDPEIESNEWPIVPSEGREDDLDSSGPEPTEEFLCWRDRLVFDFDVSDISPVVKGTWVTVGHVVSLIVDGWSWADVLRSHPELTEDDIRTCIAYTMDEENSAS